MFEGMVFQDFVFYTFAAILLFAGLRVITARNPVHAALFLVLAFFTAAGIWLLLEAEFLAIVLVLVYVGVDRVGAPPPKPADYSNTAELGRVLYSDYLLTFELAAVVLLVAIVAAIALTLRDRKDSKFINPADQVKVKRADRVRMVSMPSFKEPPADADAAANNTKDQA